MSLLKNIQTVDAVEMISTSTTMSHFDDETFTIYLCQPEIDFLSKHFNLSHEQVEAVAISHEKGHALSYLGGHQQVLSEEDEEMLAWTYASKYFYNGSAEAFDALKQLALSTYLDPERNLEFKEKMIISFVEQGLIDLLEHMLND